MTDLIRREDALTVAKSFVSYGIEWRLEQDMTAIPAIDPQPDPRDAVIARLVEALEHIRSRAISTRGDQAYREFPRFAEKASRAAIAAAKPSYHQNQKGK